MWSCVPAGNSTPSDAGPAAATVAPIAHNSPGSITTPFEDDFDRPGGNTLATAGKDASPGGVPHHLVDGSADAEAESDAGEEPDELGPNWTEIGTHAWHIENGWLCGSNVHNHGVWLNKVLPVNARIEFDAKSDSEAGDLKAELWGDGKSAATGISYTNATSYLTILGGWHNTFHVIARLNEHGTDRKEIRIDKDSDDPRQKPVTRGQGYHFKVERNDGKTIRWWVDGVEMLTFPDDKPLAGIGHDHFGFNDWEVKVCFDNVKITPISSM
ncbi:MAG: hypothetical protein ABI461_14640 [Polyangiaceae bacterium]